MSNPYPKEAVPLGPFFSAAGIDGPSVQVAVVNQVKSEVGVLNAQAASNFSQACMDWTTNGLRCRDVLKIPVPPKPVAPTPQVVNTWQDPASTSANPLPVWVWMTDGTQLPPCPDLPPEPVAPPAGHVSIGVHLFGSYWQALSDDTAPAGEVASGPSSDGTPGPFIKVMSPFGGWWMKQ